MVLSSFFMSIVLHAVSVGMILSSLSVCLFDAVRCD